jgi:hypothetical protein
MPYYAVKLWFAGFLYGAVLSVLGFQAVGYGHGSILLLHWISSPFGVAVLALNDFAGESPPTVFVLLRIFPVIFWSMVGLTLSGLPHRGLKVVFLVLILAHYSAIGPIILGTIDLDDWDWEPIQKARSTLLIGATIYLAGQVAIWITFARRSGWLTKATRDRWISQL